MSAEKDRHPPFRDAARETTRPAQEPAASQEIGKDHTAVERTTAAHAARDARARVDQYGQPRSWPIEQNYDSQSMAAQQLVKDRHQLRQKAQNQADQKAPEPQREEQRRSLTSSEDRQRRRDYSSLKVEQAKRVDAAPAKEQESGDKKKEGERKLTFFKDRHPEHDKDRGHGR